MRKIAITISIAAVLITMLYSCQNAEQVKQNMYHANGRDLYIKYCQNCHGSKGEGLNALAPPLTDTLFLKSNKQQIACYIKNGIIGPMTINNRNYNEKMPENPTLANIDIAELIVYITNSYGNKHGMYHPEQVAEDLKNCRLK